MGENGKTMNKLIKIGVPLIILIAGYIFYQSLITQIGLVNFRDSQMAEIVMSNDNHFIKTIQIIKQFIMIQ